MIQEKNRLLFRIGSLRAGGAERVLINILKALPPDRFEIDLLLNIKYGEFLNEVPDYVNLHSINSKSDNWIRKGLNVLNLKKYKTLGSYGKNLNKKQFDFEVSFSHAMPNGVIKSKNKNSKKIIWIHADVFSNNRANKNYLSKLEKHDIIVVLTEDMRTKLSHAHNALSSKIVVIGNLLYEDEITNKANASIEDFEFQSNKFVFVNVGTLSKVKGQIRLLQAFNNIVKSGIDSELLIIGEGAERDKLTQFILSNQLESKVKLMGYKENPFPYIKKANAYVHSSYAEGYGNVLVESIILGTPVICTEISSSKEILKNDEFGITTQNTRQGIENGMMEFITNEKKRNQILFNLNNNKNSYSKEIINSLLNLFQS